MMHLGSRNVGEVAAARVSLPVPLPWQAPSLESQNGSRMYLPLPCPAF